MQLIRIRSSDFTRIKIYRSITVALIIYITVLDYYINPERLNLEVYINTAYSNNLNNCKLT